MQVDELAEWVAEDINQSDEDADRYIELDSLDKFSTELAKNGHDAFARRLNYTEAEDHLYLHKPTTEDQIYGDIFFVHVHIVIELLEHIFVHEKLIGSNSFCVGANIEK